MPCLPIHERGMPVFSLKRFKISSWSRPFRRLMAEGPLVSLSPFRFLIWLGLAGTCLFWSLLEISERHPALQFFPLPLAVLLWSLYRDGSFRFRVARRDFGLLTALQAGSVILAATAGLLGSPFAAAVAFWLLVVWLVLGRVPAPRLPWQQPMVALFLITPPMYLDEKLQFGLARFTAGLVQPWLDLLQVDHALEGLIFVTAKQRFFVDEACSGRNSLLVMACMSVILSVLWGRPFLHACLALLCAIAGSIALNLARMAVVIFTTAKYGWGLDQGVMHELLGLGVFLLGLTVIVCSDRGVLFLTNPAAGAPAVSSAGCLDAAPPVQPLRRSSRWLGTAAVAGLLLLMLSVGMSAAQSFRAGRSRPPAAVLAVEFKMPDKLGEWQRQPGETVLNEVLGQGLRNQVWLFTNGERSLFLAVAHPFTGFHDTRACYRNAGWEVLGSRPPSSSWVGLEGLLITELNHPSRLQKALVGLVVLDHQGRQQAFPDRPGSFLTEARWLSRLRFNRLASEEKVGDTLVLQAFAPDTAPGSGPEQSIAEVMTAFQEVIRDQLRQMPTPKKP